MIARANQPRALFESPTDAPKMPAAPLIARVVQLDAPRKLVWREDALPEQAGPGMLLCQTLVSAISPGTELAAFVGLPPLRDGTGYPRVQGYCNVARVIGVGSNVDGFAAGDRILSFSSHRSHFQISASEVLLRLAPAMDADLIACTYLFHLGYEAVLRSNIRPGSRVLVIGVGALGLASVALSVRAGASVHVITAHDAAARRALELGAVQVLRREDVQAQTDLQADVVISTTNAWADWDIALRASARRGMIAVLGFPGRGEPLPERNPLDSRQFYFKQLRIEAVGMAAEQQDSRGLLRFNERDNLRWLADEINASRLPAGSMISGRYAADQIEAAYHALLSRAGSPVTYILDWS